VSLPPGAPGAAVVDLGAITANVRVLHERSATAELMAVVKADGYGHGLFESARAAQAGGATWLGTAQQPEAVALRDAGVEGRLFTWLHVPGNDFAAALTRDIDVSASATWALDDIVGRRASTGRTARVHLKADTVSAGTAPTARTSSTSSPRPAPRGRGEHPGRRRVVALRLRRRAGPPDRRRQREVFEEAVRAAEAAGCELEVRHLANSAATLTNSSVHYDLVRPGIAVYGLTPSAARRTRRIRADPGDDPHGPAVPGQARAGRAGRVVRTRLRHLARDRPRAGTAGVCGRHPSQRDERRPAAVHGRPHVIAGRVCMDQFVVDLGPDSTAQEGDEVVLFGADPAGPTHRDGPMQRDDQL
jgi:alanine racemase